jgi:hypothetical protein
MPTNMIGSPGQRYATRGAVYTASALGSILNVANNDVGDMLESGCLPVGAGLGTLIGKLVGANMNVTTDQPIPLFVPAGATYGITKIWGSNAQISMTTAVGGIYTLGAKAGTVIVLATQPFSAFTGPTVYAALTVVAAQLALTQTANPLYLSLTTGQGAAGTMDINVFGDVLV